MPIEMQVDEQNKILTIALVGTLTKADYQPLVAEFARLATERGKVPVLLDMTRFHGWDAGALWQEIKFDLKHLNELECLAVVGEARWQQAISSFAKPFTPAPVRYFDGAQLAEAQAWLMAHTGNRGTTAA